MEYSACFLISSVTLAGIQHINLLTSWGNCLKRKVWIPKSPSDRYDYNNAFDVCIKTLASASLFVFFLFFAIRSERPCHMNPIWLEKYRKIHNVSHPVTFSLKLSMPSFFFLFVAIWFDTGQLCLLFYLVFCVMSFVYFFFLNYLIFFSFFKI